MCPGMVAGDLEPESGDQHQPETRKGTGPPVALSVTRLILTGWPRNHPASAPMDVWRQPEEEQQDDAGDVERQAEGIDGVRRKELSQKCS